MEDTIIYLIIGMGMGAFLISLVIVVPSFFNKENEVFSLKKEKKDNAMQH